jgi:hypothetical protein
MSDTILADWKEVEREFNNDRERRFPALELPSFIPESEFKNDKWQPKLTYGDHFLYQIVFKKDDKWMMSYPKIGTFISYNFADQALVYDFATPVRTWEWRFKSEKVDYWLPDAKLVNHIEWMDSIYIFNVWKSYPNWKELKKVYRDTFYFRLDRKLKIKRVLDSK